MAGVTKIWIDQSGLSEGEIYCPDVNVCYVKKGIEIGQFFLLDVLLNFPEKRLTIP